MCEYFCLQMVLPTVLKRKHNLKGRPLLPVIRRLRAVEDSTSIKSLARLTSTRRTEAMGLEEVFTSIKDLTGEKATELLEMAGD